jgi:4-hydroxy-tetrahydrodipicolinate synthase
MLRVEALREQVQLLGQIYRQADEFMAVVRGLKCALSIAGVCEDVMCEPIEPCNAAAREEIARIVEQLEIKSSISSVLSAEE